MTWIKNKEEAKTLGMDFLRMFGFNVLAVIISSVAIYGVVFGYELFDLLSGGIEAYSLKILGFEQKAFYVVFYQMIDMVTERVGLITSLASYALMLFFNVMYIMQRKRNFTYDNMEKDWDRQKMAHLRNCIIGYFTISIIPNLYFLIKGIKGVYEIQHVINIFTQKKGFGVPNWITTFFNPQTSFYALTKSAILGLLLNFTIFYIVTAALYLKKRKESDNIL